MEREFFPEFINNYDNINFSNILYFNKGALLDNKIPFSHPHNDDKSFEKIYNERNSRFNKDEYTPVFILKQHKFFNPSTIINIAENIHTEYDVYFIIDKNITVPNLEKHKNFKIIHCDASANPTPYAAQQLYDRLKLEGKIS